MNVEVSMKKLREPQQGRSRASFERMLLTAEQLMIERGSVDFTLNEVAKAGKVSIGSIYCRFDSKDDLVHAVQDRVLKRVDDEMLQKIASAGEKAVGLEDAVHQLVDSVAESLNGFAELMRPLMLRASTDPVIASIGKQSYTRTADAFAAALLAFKDEIAHPEPARAADAVFVMLYSQLARQLGFGMSGEAASQRDWVILKEDLADMASAYLGAVPRRCRAKR